MFPAVESAGTPGASRFLAVSGPPASGWKRRTPPVRGIGTGGVRPVGAGSDVLSHRAAPAVPSAQRGLTAVFGMGTGVSPALWPPATRSWCHQQIACFTQANMGVERERGCHRYRSTSQTSLRDSSRPTRGRGTGQASRALSTARLLESPRFHLPPINVVVSHGPSEVLRPGSVHLEVGFPLRCFQRLSLPDVATRQCPWRNNRYTRGQSVPVLSY